MDERKLKVRTGGGIRNMRVGECTSGGDVPETAKQTAPELGDLAPRGAWAGSDQC